MINLNELYSKAPQLAPKSSRVSVRKKIKSFSISNQRYSILNIENPFRNNLLNNIQRFRAKKSESFYVKKYKCASQLSQAESRFSVRSSSEFASNLESADAYYRSKLMPNSNYKDIEFQKSIIEEHNDYKEKITGKLKSTMPKFLESNKKKALRSLITRGK